MSMRAIHARRIPALLAGCALLAGNAFAQGGITKNKQGKGGSVVQGAAGTEGAHRATTASSTATSRWARWPSSSRRTT